VWQLGTIGKEREREEKSGEDGEEWQSGRGQKREEGSVEERRTEEGGWKSCCNADLRKNLNTTRQLTARHLQHFMFFRFC
jgi:hypothetical protein